MAAYQFRCHAEGRLAEADEWQDLGSYDQLQPALDAARDFVSKHAEAGEVSEARVIGPGGGLAGAFGSG